MTLSTIERPLVNLSSLEMCRGMKLPTPSEHEKLVAEFLGDVEASDPGRFTETAEKYPTVSETALRDIRAREISAFSPHQEANGGAGFEDEFHSGYPEHYARFDGAAIDDMISVRATVTAALAAPPLLP